MEQNGPQDAKAGDGGEKFRMSERQRVRGTAAVSCFCESRGNLVSNTVMPPFMQNLPVQDNSKFFIRKNLEILVYQKRAAARLVSKSATALSLVNHK